MESLTLTTAISSDNIEIKEPVERLVPCAEEAEPISADKHTRWVRDSQKRISQMKHQGYVMAKESEINLRRGWVDKVNGNIIRNDDLVLMICNRADVDQRANSKLELDRRKDSKMRETLDNDIGEHSTSGDYER